MKKLLLAISLLLFLGASANSQSKKVKLMLHEIEGQWSLDESGNLTYTRIIEVPELSKDEIYSRAESYFVYHYNSGKSVIQTQDKEMGRVIGKGIFNKVHTGLNLSGTTTIDTWHILRIDAKEGRARIVLTLNEYEITVASSGNPTRYSSNQIINEFPVNPKGQEKTVKGKAFYKSHMKAISTLDEVERTLKEGNTTAAVENEDW